VNSEDYKKWKERIINLMRVDNEDEEFIEYLIRWFDSIKGSKEMELLQKYHPDFQTKGEDEIYSFIEKARFFVEGLTQKEFELQNFDSAFFLYRTLIRKEFQEGE